MCLSYQEWRRDWPCEARQPERIQGAFVSESEIMKVVDHTISQQKASFDQNFMDLEQVDSERKNIMPIAKSYSIKELLDSASYYFDKTKRRYIFEYVLICGKNDTNKHAEELIRLLKGRPCHINLIRLNEVKEKNLIATEDKMAYRFLGMLEKAGLSASLRRRMGVDIDGACGQLRQRFIEEGENI